MSRLRPRPLLVASALGAVAATGLVWTAIADEPREPLKVDYRREGGCPDGDAFFLAVQARTPKVRAARAGERARTLTVWVSEARPESVGTLSIIGEDGAATTSTRSVRAATCSDVVEALSLIAALAVDPSASTAAVVLPQTTSSARPSASSPPATSAAAREPEPTGATSSQARPAAAPSGVPAPPVPSSPPPPASSAPAAATPTATTPARVGLALGGAVDGTSLFGGRAAFGAVLLVDVERRVPWSPLLAARLTQTLAGDVQREGHTGALSLTSAAIEPCPVRWRPSRSWSALPCARVAVGRLTAEGKQLAAPESTTRLWFDVGAGARAVFRPSDVFSLEPHISLVLPLTRDRFYVAPDSTVYRAPSLAVGGGIDAAFHFP